MIDASQPLLGLAMSILDSDDAPDDVVQLHRRLINEFNSIELEIHRLGYDRFTVIAHQYCLCAFLDEAIMTSKWGMDSDWGKKSLLTTFHEETWSGDKFFTILDRLLMEPNRYLHLLEFQYICLCIGYKGKYGAAAGNRAVLEQIIREVHDILREAKGPREPLKLGYLENAVDVPHVMKWGTPIYAVIGGAVAAAILLYAGFFYAIERHTDRALVEIENILGKK